MNLQIDLHCTVCNNNTNINKDKTFFHFPSDPETRKLWLTVTNRLNLVTVLADERKRFYYRICEDHFKPAFMQVSNKVRTLKPHALPTIGLPLVDGGTLFQCDMEYHRLCLDRFGIAQSNDDPLFCNVKPTNIKDNKKKKPKRAPVKKVYLSRAPGAATDPKLLKRPIVLLTRLKGLAEWNKNGTRQSYSDFQKLVDLKYKPMEHEKKESSVDLILQHIKDTEPVPVVPKLPELKSLYVVLERLRDKDIERYTRGASSSCPIGLVNRNRLMMNSHANQKRKIGEIEESPATRCQQAADPQDNIAQTPGDSGNAALIRQQNTDSSPGPPPPPTTQTSALAQYRIPEKKLFLEQPIEKTPDFLNSFLIWSLNGGRERQKLSRPNRNRLHYIKRPAKGSLSKPNSQILSENSQVFKERYEPATTQRFNAFDKPTTNLHGNDADSSAATRVTITVESSDDDDIPVNVICAVKSKKELPILQNNNPSKDKKNLRTLTYVINSDEPDARVKSIDLNVADRGRSEQSSTVQHNVVMSENLQYPSTVPNIIDFGSVVNVPSNANLATLNPPGGHIVLLPALVQNTGIVPQYVLLAPESYSIALDPSSVVNHVPYILNPGEGNPMPYITNVESLAKKDSMSEQKETSRKNCQPLAPVRIAPKTIPEQSEPSQYPALQFVYPRLHVHALLQQVAARPPTRLLLLRLDDLQPLWTLDTGSIVLRSSGRSVKNAAYFAWSESGPVSRIDLGAVSRPDTWYRHMERRLAKLTSKMVEVDRGATIKVINDDIFATGAPDDDVNDLGEDIIEGPLPADNTGDILKDYLNDKLPWHNNKDGQEAPDIEHIVTNENIKGDDDDDDEDSISLKTEVQEFDSGNEKSDRVIEIDKSESVQKVERAKSESKRGPFLKVKDFAKDPGSAKVEPCVVSDLREDLCHLELGSIARVDGRLYRRLSCVLDVYARMLTAVSSPAELSELVAQGEALYVWSQIDGTLLPLPPPMGHSSLLAGTSSLPPPALTGVKSLPSPTPLAGVSSLPTRHESQAPPRRKANTLSETLRPSLTGHKEKLSLTTTKTLPRSPPPPVGPFGPPGPPGPPRPLPRAVCNDHSYTSALGPRDAF